jgi:hypothetical protein
VRGRVVHRLLADRASADVSLACVPYHPCGRLTGKLLSTKPKDESLWEEPATQRMVNDLNAKLLCKCLPSPPACRLGQQRSSAHRNGHWASIFESDGA